MSIGRVVLIKVSYHVKMETQRKRSSRPTVHPLKNLKVSGFNLSGSVVVKPGAYVLQCVTSTNEEFLLTSLSDFSLKRYSTLSGLSETSCMQGHRGRIRDVALCSTKPDGSLAYSCGEDSAVHVWDSRSGNKAVSTMCNDIRVPLCSLSVGLNGGLLAVGSEDGEKSAIYFYDIRSQKRLGQYDQAHTEAISQLHFNTLRPCELLSGSLDGLSCAFDVSKPGEEQALQSVLNVEGPIQKLGFFGPSLECM